MAVHVAKYEGRWRGEVRVPGFKRKAKTFDSKTDAKTWARQTESDLQRARYEPGAMGAKLTVGEAIDQYRQTGMRDLEESTVKGHLPRLIEWDKLLGGVELSKLTATAIHMTLDGMDIEGSTKNRKLAVLSAVLRHVSKPPHLWIAHNPCSEVGKWQENPGRERVLSAEEWQTLIATAYEYAAGGKESDASRKRLPCFLNLLYHTGCRRSEALRLRMSDIKFDRPNDKGDCLATFTGKAKKDGNRVKRPTVLSKQIVEQIHAMPRAGDLVFEGRYGAAPSFDNSLKSLKKHLPGNLQDVGFHTLRHTAITEMGRKGCSIHDLQVFSGHLTLDMVNRYMHSDEDDAWRVLGGR